MMPGKVTPTGLLASGARVSGHVDVAYWRDMGTPMDLVRGSADLVRGVVADLRTGVEVPLIAAQFHAGLADLLARAAVEACRATGLDTVALSGGVFQNVLLLRLVVGELEAAGLRVLTHSRVPPNDAGVSLGQVAVAAARDAR